MTDRPKGPFTLWQNYGCEGWQPTDFQSYHGALFGDRYTSIFVVQRPFKLGCQERAQLQIRIAERVAKVIALGSVIDCDAIALAALTAIEEE